MAPYCALICAHLSTYSCSEGNGQRPTGGGGVGMAGERTAAASRHVRAVNEPRLDNAAEISSVWGQIIDRRAGRGRDQTSSERDREAGGHPHPGERGWNLETTPR